MLSAGRVHLQARNAWIALGCSGHLDAFLSFSRELTSLSIGSTAVASGAGDIAAISDDIVRRSCVTLFCGCGENASSSIVIHQAKARQSASSPVASLCLTGHLGATGASLSWNTRRASVLGLAALPSAPIHGAGSSTTAQLPIGSRLYHAWYYGSKLRNEDITSVSTLDQLWGLLRRHGTKMDHVNLVTFLRQLYVVTKTAAASRPGTGQRMGAARGSKKVVAEAVAASSSRVAAKDAAALVQEVTRLVRKRTKWFDPRYAAEVVDVTANLGYTDIRMLYDMTERTLARLNEAYSKDLMILLRGLNRHSKLTAAAAAAGSVTTATARAATQGQPLQQQQLLQLSASVATAPNPSEKNSQVLNWRLMRWWYGGPTVGLLEGVERFMLAKIPTGRMAPENIDGLLRYVLELPRMNRPINQDLIKAIENDLRVRMKIYAPKPLAGVLESLVEQRRPLSPDLLESAANQFVKHGEKHGTGSAAARFLDATAAMIKIGGRSSSNGGNSSSKGASPIGWLSSRPDLLAMCLKLMAKDLPAATPERLPELVAVLVRAEVPLAALAAKVTIPGAGVTPVTPTSPTPAVPADATAAGTTAVAAAAAGFIRAHKAVVETALPRLSKDVVSKLRKAYDSLGLPYPKGL